MQKINESSQMSNPKHGKYILEDDTKTVHHVTIFNDVFEKVWNFGKQIIRDSDINDQLLAANPLNYRINQKDIISSVANIM